MLLNDENFDLFAAKSYDTKKSSSFAEFQNDLKRLVYIKKLFLRYKENDDLQMRLILNHVVVFLNCFGEGGVSMMFLKLDEFQDILKPVLLFLNYLPEQVTINNTTVETKLISMDSNIVKALREI